MSIVFPRFAANAIVGGAKGRWADQATTEGRQDKKPHIAARTVGCFVSDFFACPHIAGHHRNVRAIFFASDVSADCTLQTGAP
ncbi:hypothetical protein [Bradyrhizobium cenepequi]